MGLPLYHRFCWLRGGYGVRMSVHDLPSAIFGPEDTRDAQTHGGNILTAANLGPVALHLHDVGKLGGNVLRHDIEAYDLAIPVVGCGTLHVAMAIGRAIGMVEEETVAVGVAKAAFIPLRNALQACS